MAERRTDEGPVDYIDCEIPRDMTLREWRDEDRRPHARAGGRLRAVAAAMGRAARLRRRGA